jgi:hypothetical protein
VGQQDFGHLDLAAKGALAQWFAERRHVLIEPADAACFIGIEADLEQQPQHVRAIDAHRVGEET